MKIALMVGCGVGFVAMGVVSGHVDHRNPVDTSVVERKLREIIIAEIELEMVSVAKAVDLVRAKSREFDTSPGEPEERGVRIGLEQRRGDEPEHLVTLELEKKSLGEVLEEIGKQANRRVELFDDGVVLRVPTVPLGHGGLFVRSYRVPPDFLRLGNAPDDDPFDSVGDRRPRRMAREVIESFGIVFPEGAVASFFPSRSVLTVRINSAGHDLLESWLAPGSIVYGFPFFLRVRFEVYSVEGALALQIARRSETSGGGRSGLRAVATAMAAGDAQLMVSPSIVTRSGQRAKVETGWECQYLKGFEAVEGALRPVIATKFVGQRFEVDPVVGADGTTINVNFAFSLSKGEPTFRRRKMLSPIDGAEIEYDRVELDNVELTTVVSTESGLPMFAGILSNDAESGRAIVAFLTVSRATNHFERPVPE